MFIELLEKSISELMLLICKPVAFMIAFLIFKYPLDLILFKSPFKLKFAVKVPSSLSPSLTKVWSISILYLSYKSLILISSLFILKSNVGLLELLTIPSIYIFLLTDV